MLLVALTYQVMFTQLAVWPKLLAKIPGLQVREPVRYGNSLVEKTLPTKLSHQEVK